MNEQLTDCMECGEPTRLVGGEEVYPHRPDLHGKRFWRCDCGAYVGCHGRTPTPLGRPAGPEARKARMDAHAAFDPIWKGKRMSRSAAYRWLSEQMGIPPGETHISWMTAEEARKVVSICRARDEP